MNIIGKEVNSKCSDFSRVLNLIKTSFPKSEQYSIVWLRLLTVCKNYSFKAFYDGDFLCGITYTVEMGDYVFVLYLAVVEELRSKGYGSAILQWIKACTSKKVVLNVEVPNPNASNSMQREKRIDFYRKNGIVDTGYVFKDSQEELMVLSSDGTAPEINRYERLLKYITLEFFSLGSFRYSLTT